MRRDTCTTCGGAFKTDRDGLWSGDKREHRCESTCVKHLKQRLAAAEAELDSVADAIGTIRLDTAIGLSQKDAIMEVVTHIDRFLRVNRGVRK